MSDYGMLSSHKFVLRKTGLNKGAQNTGTHFIIGLTAAYHLTHGMLSRVTP